MKRSLVILWLVCLTMSISPSVLSAQDFYTLEFQPGSGDSKFMVLGLSADARYLSFIEIFSPANPTDDLMEMSCPVYGRLFVIDIPNNSYAVKPEDATAIATNHPLDQDCFDFVEYHLLFDLLNNKRSYFDRFNIVPGLLPLRALPYDSPDTKDSSRCQEFHLFNGEIGNLAALELQIMGDKPGGLLDVRVRSRGGQDPKEKVLQKDTKLPEWRAGAKDYTIDKVYFAEEGTKKYIIAFLCVIFEPPKDGQEKRYMCVTGEITEIWEKAFDWPEELISTPLPGCSTNPERAQEPSIRS